MARFYVEETWREGGVDVECYRVDPLKPTEAAHLTAHRMLRPDDDQVARVRLGEFAVPYPDGGFPKRVRRAVLMWLAEHAGYTDADSIEIQMWSDGLRDILARLEAAAGASR